MCVDVCVPDMIHTGMQAPEPIALRFWKTAEGNEPVRNFLSELEKSDKKKIGADIRKVQFGWPIGMPLVKSLGKGLWELRTSMPSRKEIRVFFAIGEDEMILLHAFVKKSQKTPDKEIEIARLRLRRL
jgi:phage-related protein